MTALLKAAAFFWTWHFDSVLRSALLDRAVIGELDEELDKELDLGNTRAAPLKTIHV